jgi:putative DNA primase/helicase
MPNNCDECSLALLNRLQDEITNTPNSPVNLGLDDLGNMERLVLRYGETFRYTRAVGWLYWDKTHWQIDETGRINEASYEVARRIRGETVKVKGTTKEDEAIREEIRRWCKVSKSAARLKAMVSLAESDSTVSTRIDSFDQDANLFNCTSGTINLTTLEIFPHDPKQLLTNCSPVAYSPDAQCPRWKRFVLEIMDGNQQMADFLRRAVGYSLTGETGEHCLFILWGSGSNGKTTFIEVLRHVWGTYARAADFQTFMAKKWGPQGGPSSDIAKLRGARFVSATEGEDGQKLAESLIKQITGGDTISACLKFKEPFEFLPQLKLWLSTNHKPQIVGTDEGIWRRIRLILFNVRFTKDETLAAILKAEAPGILRWAMEGLKQWREHGLMEPSEVLNATTDYRAEEDIILRFISEECETDPAYKSPARKLYEKFKDWAKNNHEIELSERKFTDGLKEHGYKKLPRTKHGVVYQGLRCISEFFQENSMNDVDAL